MKAMSKQQLADAAGVTVTTLMNWCRPYQKELEAMGMRLHRNYTVGTVLTV